MDNNISIDDYIDSLSYDENTVLADREETPKVKNEMVEHDKGVFYEYQRSIKDIDRSNMDWSFVDSLNGRIFPGAMVLCNQRLIDNIPDRVNVNTKKVKFKIDIPSDKHEECVFDVDEISKVNVDMGASKAISRWKESHADGNISSEFSYHCTEVFSEHQLSAELGFKIKKASQKFNFDFDTISKNKCRDWVVTFTQRYYSISVNDFNHASDIIDDEKVTVDELIKKNVNNENPIGIVRTVTYGRKIFAHFHTDKTEFDLNSKLDVLVNAVTDSGDKVKSKKDSDAISGEITASEKWKELKDSTSMELYVMGGGSNRFSSVTKFDIDSLPSIIFEGMNFELKDLETPIGYSVDFMKNGGQSVATVNSCSKVVVTNVVERNQCCIHMHNGAAATINVRLWWDEYNYDQNGNIVEKKGIYWSTGNFYAGTKQAHTIPGNARNLRIKVSRMTGWVGDKDEGQRCWLCSYDQHVDMKGHINIDTSGVVRSMSVSVN